METIVALTVVAELPHDLKISGRAVFAFERSKPWAGWDERSMATLAGYPPSLAEGRTPTFRLAFERTRIRSRLPLQAADKAFGRWIRPLLSKRQRMRRRIGLALASITGLRETVSVCGLTAFIPARLVPDDPTDGWIEERIAIAIEMLNGFLVALGVESGDARIGPITRGDLPAMVPVIAEEQPVDPSERRGLSWLVPIHPWRPNSRGGLRDEQSLMNAATLFRGALEGTTVWFPVLELGHLARRDGLAGRYSASIISAASAIEVLLSTIVREVGQIRGWSPSPIEGAIGSGLKNLLVNHVPPLLKISVDLEDHTSPWGLWWNHGYQLRNSVVHGGHSPSEEESDQAVVAAMHLVAAVGQTIHQEEDLRHLAFGLPNRVSSGAQ